MNHVKREYWPFIPRDFDDIGLAMIDGDLYVDGRQGLQYENFYYKGLGENLLRAGSITDKMKIRIRDKP